LENLGQHFVGQGLSRGQGNASKRLLMLVFWTFLRSMLRLLITSIVPSSPILVTLMMEALISCETTVLTKPALRNVPEDAILRRKHQIFQIFHLLAVYSEIILLKEEWSNLP
jgi:hypothetical protein